jgi:hypothetical protein
MKRIALMLALALLPSLLGISVAGAQVVQPAAVLSLAQTERAAVDLKQGMSADEVQKLLGKPLRTALKNDGTIANTSPQGTLQWIYSSTGSSAQGNLRIEFTAKTADQWHVKSWEWASY